MKYSKTKFKIHLKEGLEMQTNASPIIRGAIAFAIITVSLSLFALCVTPLVDTLVELLK